MSDANYNDSTPPEINLSLTQDKYLKAKSLNSLLLILVFTVVFAIVYIGHTLIARGLDFLEKHIVEYVRTSNDHHILLIKEIQNLNELLKTNNELMRLALRPSKVEMYREGREAQP